MAVFQDLSADPVQLVNTNITLVIVFASLVQTNPKIHFTPELPKSHLCVNLNVKLDLKQLKSTQSVNQSSTYKSEELVAHEEYWPS